MGTTRANEMNFVINHAPGAGSIARSVDSSPARYHCTTDAPAEAMIISSKHYYMDVG